MAAMPALSARWTSLLCLLAFLGPEPAIAQGARAERDLLELELEELMDLVVVAPSRQAERARDAPATILVLTRQDLALRGYRDLSEVYDDLPGMDLARAYGDSWLRNQWRGLRRTMSVPYLLLLDGQPLNHLYFNQDEIITALPMAQVERVEVVYGPSAVIYGANAFVGVVNIVTAPGAGVDRAFSGRISAGSFGRRLIDLHLARGWGEHRLSLALRHDEGRLDDGARGGLAPFSETYYADRRLWGAFADGRFGGRYASRHRHQGLDLRWRWNAWSAYAQAFTLSSGYGNAYAGDAVQNDAVWREPDRVLGIAHELVLGRWHGETHLRWRESGVADGSYFVEGYPALQPDGSLRRVVDFSYWGSENRSLTLSHDGELAIAPGLSLVAGLRREHKDLQKAYRTNYGPSVFPEEFDSLEAYPFPPRAGFDTLPGNRIRTRQWSAYAQLRRQWDGRFGEGDRHVLTLGLRHDDFSAIGPATTLRGGYSGNWGPWTLKLLYGESFNEPAPRELYGGWQGSGSDPALKPESGATRELHLGWQGRQAGAWISAWRLATRNDIVTVAGGATNLGRRDARGIDLGLRARWADGRHEAWIFASWIDAEEQRDEGSGMRRRPVGDAAEHKLYAGWTWQPAPRWTATLRGRWMAARDTVASNPVGRLPAYAVADLNLRWQALPRQGLVLALGINNLTDRRYAHPGLNDASAGIEPGRFGPDGQWTGSAGFYSSLLPQPGRAVQLSLEWNQ